MSKHTNQGTKFGSSPMQKVSYKLSRSRRGREHRESRHGVRTDTSGNEQPNNIMKGICNRQGGVCTAREGKEGGGV